MKLTVGIPLTTLRPAQLSFRPLSIVHRRRAPDHCHQFFDLDVFKEKEKEKSPARTDHQPFKPVERAPLDHPNAWDTSNVYPEGSTRPTERTACTALFIHYFTEVMSSSNLTKQKRMLTQATSQLGKVNLIVSPYVSAFSTDFSLTRDQEILENDNAWMTLSKEIRQGLYDQFPAPLAGAEPRDIDINPLHSMFRPYVEDAITAWQEDLREGRETKKWRQDATDIAKQRELGKFDEYRTTYREEWWGSSDGEDGERKKVNPQSDLPTCEAPHDPGHSSTSKNRTTVSAKTVNPAIEAEKTTEGSEASFRTTTTDANSASMYAAQPPRLVESFRTETTEADTVVDDGAMEEKEDGNVPMMEEDVPKKKDGDEPK